MRDKTKRVDSLSEDAGAPTECDVKTLIHIAIQMRSSGYG